MLDLALLFCAVVGGAIVLLQLAMTLLGVGDDGGDFDADGGGFAADLEADAIEGDHTTPVSKAIDADIGQPGGLRLFEVLSLRGIVAAIAFFGLGGMWARASDMSPTTAVLVGCGAGAVALYGIYWVMKQLYKLRSTGTANIHNATGRPATIYVPVPANGDGRGKVHVTLQGRTMEYEAVTDGPERLETGEPVQVTAIVGSDLVRVGRPVESVV